MWGGGGGWGKRGGGCIAMDLVLRSGHITVCSGCLSHRFSQHQSSRLTLTQTLHSLLVKLHIRFRPAKLTYPQSAPLPSLPLLCVPVLTSASGCTTSRSVVKEGETSPPLQGNLVADKVLSVADFSWPEVNTRFLEGELQEEKGHTHHAGMGQCTQNCVCVCV